MAEQNISIADLTSEQFGQLLRDSSNDRVPNTPSSESERMLLWLGLVPAWPRRYVAAGFPTGSGMATGTDATEAVDLVVKEGFAESGQNDTGFTEPIYWMTQVQSDRFLGVQRDRPGGRKRLLAEMPVAALALRGAASSTGFPLPPQLERWCRIAEAGPNEQAMAEIVDEEIDGATRAAEERKDTACPEARWWIETVTPLAELIGGPLHVSLIRGQRRFELFYRRASDLRHLRNFLERPSQIDAFNALIDGPDDRWALHFVGVGGFGKTMLMRHITAKLAPSKGLAVARVDFDPLNPEYPTRAPALLLTAFAAELRLLEKTSSSVFDYFFGAAKSLHERIDADRLERSLDIVARDVEPVVRAFVDALQKLGLRPLLVLDTCEELAKLRPDGRIPENVRMTFGLLERLHQEIPQLRVVFSGRRPLAQRGAGWTCDTSSHPPRDYLALHIVSGFAREEAVDYLSRFRENDRMVAEDDYDTILTRSVAVGRALEHRFTVTAGAEGSGTSDRFNPRELSRYASLASVGKLAHTSGAHVWVKERIVYRVSDLVAPRLPLLALLGTFNRPLLERFFAVRGGSERVIDEILQYEWAERSGTAADPFWMMDADTREKLLAFYGDQPSAPLADAERRIQEVLPAFTRERPWRELNVVWFAATLRLLQRNAGQALAWWREVEKRLTHDGEYAWAHSLTSHLLASDDGTWQQAEKAVPDPLLRASIGATHAAAAARMEREATDELWEVVIRTIPRAGDQDTIRRLRHRAHAGAVQALQHSTAYNAVVVRALIQHLSQTPVVSLRDDDECAVEIALLEGAVEILERASEDPAMPRSVFDDVLQRLLQRNPNYDPFRPMSIFFTSLNARIAVMRGDREEAEKLFRESVSDPQVFAPRSLDWTSPEDPFARLRLEAARGLALRYDVRLFRTSERLERGSLDADRFYAANIMIARASRSIEIALNMEAELKLAAQLGPPRCNAHRLVPSGLSVGIEATARFGAIDDALAACRLALSDAEQHADVFRQNDIARVYLRLITDYRLFEEGEEPPKAAFQLDERSDAEAVQRFNIVAGRPWEEHAHASRWSSFLVSRTSRNVTSGVKIENHSTFDAVWVAAVNVEATADSAGREQIADWIADPQRNPVDAMRVWLRAGLTVQKSRPMLDELAERIGRPRAAEIVVAEYEVESPFRLVDPSVLARAAEWFELTSDRFGVLRATILAIMQPAGEAMDAKPITAASLLDRLPENGIPPAEQIMSALRSRRGFITLASRITEPRFSATRPWLLRLLTAAAATGDARDRLVDIDNLVNGLHQSPSPEFGRFGEVRKRRRSAISGLAREVGIATAATFLASASINGYWKIAGYIRDAFTALPIGSSLTAIAVVGALIYAAFRSREAGRPMLISFAIAAPIWSLLYFAIPERWLGKRGSFASITTFDFILVALVYAAFQGSRVAAMLTWLRIRFARKLTLDIGTSKATDMVLSSPLGDIRQPFGQRIEDESPAVVSHILLRNRLTDETATQLDDWIEHTWRSPLPASIVFGDVKRSSFCWEAMLDPSWFSESEDVGERRLSISRQVQARMHRPERSRIVEIATVAHDRAIRPFAPAWDAISSDRFSWRPAAAKRNPQTRVVHLIGTPVLVRDELRLQTGESSESERGDLLRPDFAADVEETVFCIVQGQPTEGPSTESDRAAAAMLREFGAEVARSGIPLVIVIPSLRPPIAFDAIAHLARAIVGFRLQTVDDCVAVVDELRTVIAQTDADLAYDLCVYIDHAPELRPRFSLFSLRAGRWRT